jgi:hypothetical protein
MESVIVLAAGCQGAAASVGYVPFEKLLVSVLVLLRLTFFSCATFTATANHNNVQQQQQLNGRLQGLAALLSQQQQQQQNQVQNSQSSNLVDWISLLLTNNNNSRPSLSQQPAMAAFGHPQQQQQPSLAMFQNMAAAPSRVSPTPPHLPPMTVASQATPSQQSLPMQLQLQGNVPIQQQQQQLLANMTMPSHHPATPSNDIEEILRKLQRQVASVNTSAASMPPNNNHSGSANLASMYAAPPPGFPFPSESMLSKIGVRSKSSSDAPKRHHTKKAFPKPKQSPSSHSSVKNMPAPKPILAGTTSDKQILLYRDIDDFYLTEYQCVLRQQIELFEATMDDVQASAQGRNSPIEVGQVGIRCKYCSMLPLKCRTRGAVYFPRSIDGIYQVAQNLTKIHLCQGCNRVPENLRKKLTELSKVNKRASGGKRYWNERVRELGVYEDGKGIRFKREAPATAVVAST